MRGSAKLHRLAREAGIPIRLAAFRPITRADLQAEALWWKGKSIVLRGHIEAIRASNTGSEPRDG